MDYPIRKVTLPPECDMMASLVKQALEEDFPAYRKETVEAYQSMYSPEYFRKSARKKDSLFLGAFDGTALAGFMGIKKEFGGVLFFDWLAVAKPYRRRGIATVLLETAQEWGQKNGYHYAYLFTETESNRRFYEKRGFNYVGTHPNSWFHENEHIYSKLLAPLPENR